MRKLVRPLLALLVGVLLAADCSGQAPERDFTTKDLLIDLSVFPSGWRVTGSPAPPFERVGQIGGSQVEFRASEDPLIGAVYSVFRFRSQRAASTRYERMQPSWFNSSSVASVTPWQVPDQLSYLSPIADRSQFACHDTNVGGKATICQFFAQYDEYIIVFHTVMTPEDMEPKSYMTFTDLESILKAIDERLEFYLRSSRE